MQLLSLFLSHFRCFKEAYFEFSPKVNLIYGENAQGKTSLLEAISILMTGRSFRTPNLDDLIYRGAPSFHIEARFIKHGIEQKLQVTWDGSLRTIYLNTTKLPSTTALFGTLMGVILSPEDNALIKGGPAERRSFLDIQIGQTNPLYLYHLSRFLKAMKNRNFLLRGHRFDTIEVWEAQMALSASFLTVERHRIVKSLESERASLQKQLGYPDPIAISYKSSLGTVAESAIGNIQHQYLMQYAKNRLRESELGYTLNGPHRDDLFISMHGREARYVASEGQQRSCIAMLKLADWKRIQTQAALDPLMCIDDIGISLDEKRETKLLKFVQGLGQVFLTTPTTMKLDQDLMNEVYLLQVQNIAERAFCPI